MLFIKKSTYKDFSDGPVVKTLISNAGGAGSILGQGTKIPHACGQKMKPQNRRNIAKSSIKTLKLVHIGKKKKRNHTKWWVCVLKKIFFLCHYEPKVLEVLSQGVQW